MAESERKAEDRSRRAFLARFYQRYKGVRASITDTIRDDVGPAQGLIMAQKLLDKILFTYFLCSKGFIKVNKMPVSARQLFSTEHLLDGNFLENFKVLISTHKHSFPFNKDEIGLSISLASEDWEGIFGFFNEFTWRMEEVGRAWNKHDGTLTSELLGYIHERTVSEKNRKKKGVFYTPLEITEYICRTTIQSNILRKIGIKDVDLLDFIESCDVETNRKLLLEILELTKSLKVLDPACGSGAFLVRAGEYLYKLQHAILSKLNVETFPLDMKKSIIHHDLHGIDLQASAIEIAKLRLCLWVLSSLSGSDDSITNFWPKFNLAVGNALIGWSREDIDDVNPENINERYAIAISEYFNGKKEKIGIDDIMRHQPFHWPLEFRDVMESGGFDIIIGNPPYVFVRGRNFDIFERQFYKSKYLKDYEILTKGKARQSGKVNSYGLFIVRAVDLLKNQGILGFIIPNTILRITTNDIIRQFIVKQTHVEEIVDLEGGVFPTVSVSTIIMILKKISERTFEKTTIKHSIRSLLDGEHELHDIDQYRFLNNVICCFNIHVDEQFQQIFEIMKEDSFELGTITKEIIEGFVPRKGENLFTDDPSALHAKKYLEGKNIDRYVINWKEGQYIKFIRNMLHRPRPDYVHEAPEKLITQRIGGGKYPLRIAYDNKQHYVYASTNSIILKDKPIVDGIEYGYKYILALLNSKIINAYYLLNYSNRSTYTVNITKTFLEALPIKKASREIQEIISSIVDVLIFLSTNQVKHQKLIKFFDETMLDSLISLTCLNDGIIKDLQETLLKSLRAFNADNYNEISIDAIHVLHEELIRNKELSNLLKKVKELNLSTLMAPLFKDS